MTYGTVSARSPARPWLATANYDGIAPVQNSAAIVSHVGGAELRGYEGGHLFLFQDPSALPEFEAFLQAPPG
jgi:3-oxoadipate enol-lactonase